ncbi:MAG: 50S ribosomal protein P1 [Candidatus Aenigmarchaeota archaeon]|nr:50S ribosomal protein P1 [Candidatus Aenigmarchaeota archaeon]
MEMVYAAMLLHSMGKDITEDAVKKVIDATGEKADETKVKALVASLKDVNIEEAISKAAVTAAAPAASTGGSAPAEAKKEEKKEEDTEKKAEEAAAGLGALFG